MLTPRAAVGYLGNYFYLLTVAHSIGIVLSTADSFSVRGKHFVLPPLVLSLELGDPYDLPGSQLHAA